jgi:hypothetical protein
VEKFELGRKWCLYWGRKSGLQRMWFGRDSFLMYEIWSLEGSYGVDVIACYACGEAKCRRDVMNW